MTPFAALTLYLAVLALAAAAAAVALVGMLGTPGGRHRLVHALAGRERHPIAWAWGVALVATAGSLYLSEGAGLVPCVLCWYQRIAMYPLVLVLGVALVRGDPGGWRFALPLPLIGLAISSYHVAIQLQPDLDVGTCTSGVPCTARYIAVFGFVSIPVMAGAAFLLILALLLLLRTLHGPEEGPAPVTDAA